MFKYSKPFILAASLLVLIVLQSKLADDNIIRSGGYVKNNNDKLSGVLVKIFDKNIMVEEMVTDRQGRYAFLLDFNKNYRIELAKQGYLKTIIYIDTKAPREVVKANEEILWQSDLYMFKQMPGMNMDCIDKPVARFNYHDWFIIEDSDFEDSIAPFIDSLKTIIKQKEQIAYNEAINLGNSMYNAGKYEEAIIAFQTARKFNDQEKSIKKQLKQAIKKLKNEVTPNNGYLIAIETGDSLLLENKLDMALNYYQKAAIYKPKEAYPVNKLYEIDSVKSYRWIAKNKQYDKKITTADSLFKSSMYNSSKNFYKGALDIFQEKTYPKNQIVKIDSILSHIADSISKTPITKKDSIVKTDSVQLLVDTIQANRVLKTTPIKPYDTSKIFKDTLQTEKIKPNVKHDSLSTKLSSTSLLNLDSTINAQTSGNGLTKTLLPDKHNKPEKADNLPSLPIVAAKTKTGTGHNPIDTATYFAFSDVNTSESLKKLNYKLTESIKKGDKQRAAVVLEEIGMIYQSEFKLAEALETYSKSLELKRSIGDKKGEAETLNNIASVMYDSGSYNQAIETFETSLEIADKLKNDEQKAEILTNIATVYENTYRYNDAIDYLQKSLNIKEKTGDIESSGQISRSIGNLYYEQNNFDKAIQSYEKSIELEKKQEDNDELSSTLNSMGAAYYGKKDYGKAVEYFQKSIEITKKTNNLREQSISLNNIGNINYDFTEYAKAIDYYEQSLKIKTEISFFEGMATTLHNIGNAYFALKDFNKALEYYTNSLNVAEKEKLKAVIWRNYEAFAKTYSALGQHKQAYEYQKKYTHSKYEIVRELAQLVEMREQYESGKIAVKKLKMQLQKQNRLARYEAEQNRLAIENYRLEVENKQQKLEKQRNIIITFVIGSLLILLFAFIVTNQYQQKNKAYKIVAEQKQHIMDGISYASRIQKAVLPTEELINHLVPNRFIINKPRDVVGGDFYWAARHQNKAVIAVADCTGHGVPGGFMSMLGIAILNEIISTDKAILPHEILNQLRQRVMVALHQVNKQSETMDGMDITLISIDPETRVLQFSGAYHTLFIGRNNQIETHKGNRMPIGYHFRKNEFTTETIQMDPGDMIYMTSDGIIDQIGEHNMLRFMASNFKNVLLEIHQKPLEEQKAQLEKIHAHWKGKLEQTDDILVLGIRM